METVLVITSSLTCSFLLVLNIYQFRYWSKQNQALVDKLMSRNYAEYAQTEKFVSNYEPRTGLQIELPENDNSFEDPASILNKQMGFS